MDPEVEATGVTQGSSLFVLPPGGGGGGGTVGAGHLPPGHGGQDVDHSLWWWWNCGGRWRKEAGVKVEQRITGAGGFY